MAGHLRANTSASCLTGSTAWGDGWSDSPVSHPAGAGLPPFAPVRGDGEAPLRRVFASSGSLLSSGSGAEPSPRMSRQLGSESPVMSGAPPRDAARRARDTPRAKNKPQEHVLTACDRRHAAAAAAAAVAVAHLGADGVV